MASFIRFFKYMLCPAVCLCILGLSAAQAKVRYSGEMNGFIGTWTATDPLGNIDKYNIRVVNGCIEVLFRHIDVVNDFVRTDCYDCTYVDGSLIYDMNFPETSVYNHVALYLKNGSLIEYNRHSEPGNDWTRERVYQLDF